jgi:hypothetical protein
MAIDGKKILVLAPLHNTGAKKDATGAFQPEAAAFAKRHGVPKAQVVWIDNHLTKSAMRKAVLAAIEKTKAANGEISALALCCHGWKDGIQFGFSRANVGELAKAIAAVTDVRVVLYACSTAQGEGGDDGAATGGDGGFADRLRDALCQEGAVDCQVDAHTVSGHTTWNPKVRRFQGMGSPCGGAGGFFIVSPTQGTLYTKWKTALKNTNLRYDFPFLSVAEIHTSL